MPKEKKYVASGPGRRYNRAKGGEGVEFSHWQAANNVGVWLASIGGVPDGAWAALYARMDPERQARCQRYRRGEDRARCVLADALAREVLHALTGADPAAISFARHPGGKPYAPELNAQFSLSHSGSLVLCAGAAFPVGADLQWHRAVSDRLLQRARRAGYDGNSQADFFGWWTSQEAYGKLSGRGLRLEPMPEGLWWSRGQLNGPEGVYSYSICALEENVL